MPRPCTCDKITCRLCHLYHADPRYRKLWGDDQEQVVAQAAPTPKPKPTTIHRHYLISLKRRPDRREQALAEFERAGIKPFIFDAIDGSKLPLPAGWKDGHGAYGCLESHKRVLEDAILNGLDCIAVFEDDVVFTDDFQAKLSSLLATVPEDWDGVFIGGQHRKTPKPVKEGVLRCSDCHRTHGYILKGEYIRELYRIWASNMGHADHIWGRYQSRAKLYAADPWLCCQGENKSDINGREEPERCWDRKGSKKLVAQQSVTPAPAAASKDCGCHKTAQIRKMLDQAKKHGFK